MNLQSARMFVLLVGLSLFLGCLGARERRANKAYNRGVDHLGADEFDEAIEDFTKAIRINPRFADAYCCRSVAHAGKGDFDKAVDDCNEAIRLNPQNGKALTNRGIARFHAGRYDRAIADYALATRVAPDDAVVHEAFAWFLATCPEAAYRDGKQAVLSATKACELTEWKAADCVGTLAAAYAEAGDFRHALKWQEQALSMAPAGEKEDHQSRLALYQSGKPCRKKP